MKHIITVTFILALTTCYPVHAEVKYNILTLTIKTDYLENKEDWDVKYTPMQIINEAYIYGISGEGFSSYDDCEDALLKSRKYMRADGWELDERGDGNLTLVTSHSGLTQQMACHIIGDW